MSRPLRLLVACLAISVLAACGGSSGASDQNLATSVSGQGDVNQLAERAKDEGELTVYTVASEEVVTEWVRSFEEKYGIHVSTYRASQSVLWERWAQETQVDQGLADVVIMNDPQALAEADKQGWLAEFTPSSDGKYEDTAKRAGKWYSIYQTVEPLAWNRNKVSPAEAQALRTQGLQALADPRWRGRVAVVAPQATERVLATYDRWTFAQKNELGWPFVEKLAATAPAVYESAVPVAERLSAGEFAVVLGSADSLMGQAVADGAPIEFSYPDPATGAPFVQAVSANGENPNAARLFQEWATTPDALSSLSELSQGMPPYEGVPDRRAFVDKEWYSPPENIDEDWIFDKQLAGRSKQLLDRWATTFQYGG
ncbi:MAG: extracellular solute-binding protein [Streptosporangiales bacterium]|nr:extracellular solute-binding protein [Streptosporangiales bacterium]